MSAPRKLLIIDDERDFADLILRVAEPLGFEAKASQDARSFQALYQDWGPDLIVLDMIMPEMDGIELMRWLVAQGCRARVIIISGHSPIFANAATAIAELRGQMSVSFLQKPVKLHDLRAALTG